MHTYNHHICLCFRPYPFVLAPLSETSEGVGTVRTLGSRCPRFGRDPCSVSRVAKALVTFLALGIFKADPGFPHPLSPCTYVRFGEAVFSARSFSVFFFAKIADDRQQTTCGEHNATYNPAAQQQQLATPCMYACAHDGVSSL